MSGDGRSTLYLCGAGNSEGVRLALACAAADASRWAELVLLDDDESKWGSSLLGVAVRGPIDRLHGVDPERADAVNLVARSTRGRERVHEKILTSGVSMPALVHPGVDTLGAEVRDGALVYPGATLGPETVVGEGSVVFMGAVVGHESIVGRDCVLASGCVLNARVRTGDRVYVGTNASVLPEVVLGDDVTVGSNSSVIRDVPARATVVGVPGEVLMAQPPSDGRGGEVARTEDGTRMSGVAHHVPVSEHEIEREIVAVFGRALEVESVPSRSNFFDIGGDSLKALQVATRVHEVTGLDVRPLDVFHYPSAHSLAMHLAEASAATRAGGATDIAARRRRAREMATGA